MATQINKKNDGFLIEGAILIDNARMLVEEGKRLFGTTGGVIDLAAVTEVDSSAVSLLMEYQREAQRNGVQTRFVNVPENLKSLAKLYGVADLIPS